MNIEQYINSTIEECKLASNLLTNDKYAELVDSLHDYKYKLEDEREPHVRLICGSYNTPIDFVSEDYYEETEIDIQINHINNILQVIQ